MIRVNRVVMLQPEGNDTGMCGTGRALRRVPVEPAPALTTSSPMSTLKAAMRRPISAVVLFLSLAPVTFRAASAQSWPWSDPALAPERRAELLVAAMTLDEKIALVHGADGPYCGDVPANTRLGIPSIGLSDGPAGVTCWSDPITGVTAFPAPVSVAAAWDPAQAREIGAAIGTEARGKGIDVVLAPMLNTVRDGRFGRAFEVYGEDPWLAAALAGPIVRGIEGAGAIATPKAFVNNDQETLRGASSSEVSERACSARSTTRPSARPRAPGPARS